MGAASFESGVRSAVATITAGGDVSQQAVSAVVSTVTSAASHMGNLIAAKRGANIKPETALIMAGELALQSLPEVVSALPMFFGVRHHPKFHHDSSHLLALMSMHIRQCPLQSSS